ncbi:DUF3710 domain-containing protein [Corynebacterium sp. HMSC063F04]|uniref:DUF3710 domain-containing protein n=1 Tax=Corynebacterium sp. HMSC063F04 TaxID=1739292 RepID=UPI0008A37018|nr:DUF3710 domain-containing protein [Corynebacterium sp. HMSC063F04]OFL09835.1 hypothetical protein HMPREF2788_07680 [Corynebacterium sp. HMSC063F04]
MWPFGKKNQPEEPAAEAEAVTTESAAPASEEAAATLHDDASEVAAENAPANGPFDINSASPTQFDFSDFAKASLNLGSMLLPIPHVGDIQVEMGPTGPTMLHVATEHGRVTPVAFAAPTSGGLWEESAQEIKDGLESDGLDVHVEQGPWGSEVVGRTSDMEMRIIGADGPRWMLRMTASGPADRAEKLADLARGLLARSFVSRGENPMPAGQPLPVTLPSQMAEQIRQAYQQQAQAAQAEGEPGKVPGATGINPDGSTN